MSSGLYLTVDCSTTASKAVVFGADGHAVASAAQALSLDQPHEGWREQDPEQWWTATVSALREVAAGIDVSRLTALCLTHQRESFVCLDADGRALRPAILWMDTRAGAQIAEFGSERVATVSGKPPDVTPSIYKLAWLTRHEPSVLRDAVQVGDVQAFLAQRLTGRWATGLGSADALGLLDLRRGEWDDDLMAVAGVRQAQLPALVASGEAIGTLMPAVADLLGLPAGLPLVAGTGDGQAAALGADAQEPGRAYLNLGTSMVMGTTVDMYTTSRAYRTLAGGAPGTFVLETLLNSAGYLVAWFRREFGDDPSLEPLAVDLPPGCDGLLTLPYWNAVQSPFWNPHARGATVGWNGNHTRAHFYRSLLEGVVYELRLHLDGLPHDVRELYAVGGGTRNQLWTQMVADVTGRPVVLQTESEISAKGAAVLADAFTTGRTVAQSAAALATPGRTIHPDRSVATAYATAFDSYRRIYPALATGFFQPSA